MYTVANEEMGATTIGSWKLKMCGGTRRLLGYHTKCSGNESSSYQMWVSLDFAQKGPVSQFDLFRNVFNKGFYGVRFFEYSSDRESTAFMNFQYFLLNFK